jgi:hypothetical protein
MINTNKSFRRTILGITFAFAFIAPLRGQNEAPLGKTSSNWPGVDFEVTQIVRVAPDRLVVVVRVHTGSRAANPTLLSFPKKRISSDPSTYESGLPGLPVLPDPFSLQGAVLVDNATRNKYAALADLPSKPFFGPNAAATTMRPNEFLQMAVQFPAPPPPPPDQFGKVPEQKVSVVFPHAKLPVKDLVIPPPSK